MFKASQDLKPILVRTFGTPHILIDKREILLNGGRKVIIIPNKIAHPPPLKVINLIQDNIDPLLEVALFLALPLIQLPVKLEHRILTLVKGPLNPVLDQLKNPILDQDHGNVVLSDTRLSQVLQV